MKVLVTGKQGQLARCLAERAVVRPGIELVAVGRPEMDLEVPGSAERSIRDLRPDVVLNAAALTDVDGAEEHQQLAMRVNSEAAGEVAGAAADLGIPVIQISTDYVFDGTSTAAYSENSPTAPINSYGRSKLAGEEAVRAVNPRHLILRTAWVYSPFGRNFVKTMFDAVEQRDELRVVADHRGSPTSALDLADGVLVILDKLLKGQPAGLGETYHLAGSGEASWYDLAEQVMAERRHLGLMAARLIAIPASSWPMRAVRPACSVLDCGKFERDFGFAMPDWRGSVGTVVQRLAGAD